MTREELLFATIPSLLPRLHAPDVFIGLMRPKRSDLGRRWMSRNEVEEERLTKGGWNVFLLSSLAMLALVTTAVLLFGLWVAVYSIVPSILVPIVLSSLYLNTAETYGMAEERRMLGESPAIIGCMTMSMQVRPSLEQAVLFAAEREEGVLPLRLKEALWANVTRSKGSLSEAVNDLSSSLSRSNDSLRQSLHLVVSAACERTKVGMDRLLDKANDVALTGVRNAVDSYIASLSLPAMVLFSLGTLLPIMLFSVLPLLSLGSSLGTDGSAPTVPLPHLAFLLLGIIPVSAVLYAWSVLSRHPLGMVADTEGDLDGLFPPLLIVGWAAAIVAAWGSNLGPYALSGAVVLTPCPYLIWRLRSHVPHQRRREVLKKEATAALFQVGNRMVSGATFEGGLKDVMCNMEKGEFTGLVKVLLYRSRLTGKGIEGLIIEEGTLRSSSPMVENAYTTVVRCAGRDPINAGQIALHLAQMLSDLQACRNRIEERLRGVIDMMRSTGTVFAPLVLGVTGALFSLIDQGMVASQGSAGNMELITGVYIGELSFLVSLFTVFIMGERSWKGVAHCYATRTPVAFSVFVLVSLICRTGLSGLM